MSGEVRRVMDAGAAAAGMMAQPPPPPPPPDMDSGYPDSVGSSPRSSRDNDTDFNRWDAAAGGGAGAGAGDGNRVRLMCSFGGRIMPRPHDNQLTYAGGETRILAVDRNIRYNVIMARLAAFTGVPVSFKYQLPTEDLDALVSVTNDEDLDNMMAEYDRLCKHGGFRFSRLRLFLFRATGADAGASSDEAGKKDGWFVDALNAGVSRSESGGGAGSENSAWSNNIPDYLFGLEGKSAADEADLAGNEGGSVRSSSSRISEPDVPERRRREPEEPVAPPPQPHVHQHQLQHQLQHQQQQQHHQQQQQQPVPVQEFQRLQIRQQQQHQQQQQQPHQAPPPQQVPQPVKVMNPEPVYSAASSAPTVADYGNVPEPPAPAPVAPPQQFVTPQQPVTYWDPHTHQQVYVVHAPVPTPVQQRAPQPAVAPVPTQVAAPYYVARSPAVNVYGGGERPAPVVQRQPVAPTSAELTEAYREPPAQAKVPAPVYAQGPVAGGVIYRPAHTEGGQYVYHHGGMVYEAPAGVGGAPRPVFYTQSGTPVMGNVGVAATAVPVTYSSAPSDMGPTRATQSS